MSSSDKRDEFAGWDNRTYPIPWLDSHIQTFLDRVSSKSKTKRSDLDKLVLNTIGGSSSGRSTIEILSMLGQKEVVLRIMKSIIYDVNEGGDANISLLIMVRELVKQVV